MLTDQLIAQHLSGHGQARLEAYSRQQADYRLITDLLAPVAELVFHTRAKFRLDAIQQADYRLITDLLAPVAELVFHTRAKFRLDAIQQLIAQHLSGHDLARLEAYSRQQADYRLITDLLAPVAELVFHTRAKFRLDAIQQLITQHLSGLDLARLEAYSRQQADYRLITDLLAPFAELVFHTRAKFRLDAIQQLIAQHLSGHDQARLEAYSRQQADYRLITDLLAPVTELVFHTRAKFRLDAIQQLIAQHLSGHDLARLEAYSRQQADYRLITDLLAPVAELVFHTRAKFRLDAIQQLITQHLSGLNLARLEAYSRQQADYRLITDLLAPFEELVFHTRAKFRLDAIQQLIAQHLSGHDLARLEAYCRQQADYRLITDLLAPVAELVFHTRAKFRLDAIQQLIAQHLSGHDQARLEAYSRQQAYYRLITDLLAPVAELVVLIAMGFQMKDVDDIASELGLPGSQILAKFYEGCKKINATLNAVLENTAAKEIGIQDMSADDSAVPVKQSLNEELTKAAKELERKQRKELSRLMGEDLMQYRIKGSDLDWGTALDGTKQKHLVSVKR
ncbi:Uncharacterized protein OBRU01_00980 [Operophtera brumata]|uniref:Possible tRNA binding domain-containing protein n=1 Tax=Operophtera brumata TaxID=104452 RepID=A0A0L7LTJ8_OPEBR|nr:Uncharacterized protein OBRU01_00980 [Operophtera brumata]